MSVRIVANGYSQFELNAREPTLWELPPQVDPANYFDNTNALTETSTTPAGTYKVYSDVLYEITFQGEWHDAGVTLGAANMKMQNWLQPPQTTLANGSRSLAGASSVAPPQRKLVSPEISAGMGAPPITVPLSG